MRSRKLAALGAAACLACYAGPILALLGGIGALGLVGSLFIGVGGLIAAVAAAIEFVVVRRRRALTRDGEAGPAPVELSMHLSRW